MNEPKLICRQYGMSMYLLVFLLLAAGFIAMAVLKVAPTYMEYGSVRGVLSSLQDSPAEDIATPLQIREAIMRRLQISSVYSVERNDISIERLGPNSYKVGIAYEVRKPFLGNVDIVVYFDREIELSTSR